MIILLILLFLFFDYVLFTIVLLLHAIYFTHTSPFFINKIKKVLLFQVVIDEIFIFFVPLIAMLHTFFQFFLLSSRLIYFTHIP